MARIDLWVDVTFADGKRVGKQSWFKSMDADRVPIAGDSVSIPKTPSETGETGGVVLAVKSVMFYTERDAASREYSASVTLEDTDENRLTVADLEAAGFVRPVSADDDAASETEPT